MRKLKIILIAAAAGAAALVGTAAQAQKEPAPVQLRSSSDAEMNRAVAQARASLPVFWRVFETSAADADSYNLKIAFRARGGGREHMWVDVLEHHGDEILGLLLNEPEYLDDLKPGDQVRVKAIDISDWSYRKGGRNYGQFTTRVMLEKMTPKEAAEIRAALSPQPLEPGAR